MATYGSGQMLGSGINPESFKQDYSGFTRAAEMQAQGLQNLGGSIAGAIKDYGQAKQERKKLDAGIKATVTGIESAIKMGDSLGIDVKSSLTPYLDKINDPNVTPTEAAAYAQEASSAINNILNFGMKANQLGIEEDQNIRAAKIKQAEMEAAANKPGPVEAIAARGGLQQMERNPRTGVFEPIKVAPLSSESNLVDFVKKFEGFNPNAYSDYKQTSIGYGTKGKEGEVINEEQATERLKSELSESAKRIERASILKGVSLNENQLNSLASFDYNTGKGIDLIERFGNKPNELAAKMQEYTKAGGKTLPGLVERRQIEAALFMTPPQPPVGFTPAKTAGSETYRPFTPEEIALYGSQGQVSSTGKVYPIRPPSGTEFTVNPDGSTTYKQGAGVGAKAEGVAKAQEQMKGESFRLNQANTEEAFGRLDVAGTNNPLFAAGNSLLAKALPASEVGELESFFERINGENSFAKMSQLRASSPTGGAAGTMTEKEWPRFEGRFSPLKANARKDTLAKSLSLNLLNAFEAANGMPEDIIKAFDEKKIDQAQYDKYVNDYVMNRQIARVNANGVEGESYDWTRLNKKLLSRSTIFEAPSTSGSSNIYEKHGVK